VEDIQKDGAFDEAVKGVDAVEHTASPYHLKAHDPAEVINPALKGTLGILESIKKNGHNVKRVVVTSSIAAVVVPRDPPYTFTEVDWNDYSPGLVEKEGVNAPNLHKYRASKALAERAAWDFAEKNKAQGWDLVTINPPLIYGPIIHEVSSLDSLNTSIKFFYEAVLDQQDPEELTAPMGSWVDVRDVATLHVEALLKEEAGGERFLAVSSTHTYQDFLDALNDAGVPGIQKGTPGGGKGAVQVSHSGEKASRVFGIKFRGFAETGRDTVQALRARGW